MLRGGNRYNLCHICFVSWAQTVRARRVLRCSPVQLFYSIGQLINSILCWTETPRHHTTPHLSQHQGPQVRGSVSFFGALQHFPLWLWEVWLYFVVLLFTALSLPQSLLALQALERQKFCPNPCFFFFFYLLLNIEGCVVTNIYWIGIHIWLI